MIEYVRTEWYGFNYFFYRQGHLLPRLLPVIVLSGVLAGVVASNRVEGMDWCDDEEGTPLFEHPYAFQLFGIVFGYLSIARLNISISRYFEGVTQIKIMHSKWGDAALQIVVFDRLTDDDMTLEDEPFSIHIMHQFKQLSALATMHLHGEELKSKHHGKHEGRAGGNWELLKRRQSEASLISPHTMPIPPAAIGATAALSTLTIEPEVHRESSGSSGGVQAIPALNFQDKTHDDMVDLQALFDAKELEYFDGMTDLVHAQISRILRSITTRQLSGGVKAPAPIVSRVFQELSNGVLAYNNACKMKEVPVPFALVHFGALLLAFFNFTAPVVIACFTGNLVMSIVSSIIVVSGFSALWLVANELEDPFGYDANDMPMIHYHNDFCRALDGTVRRPWMAKDRWTVMTGNNPAAGADEVSSRGPSPEATCHNNGASSSAAQPVNISRC